MGLVLGGGALGILMPLLGGPLASVGVAVLLYSLIRVRVASHAADPYKDIAR